MPTTNNMKTFLVLLVAVLVTLMVHSQPYPQPGGGGVTSNTVFNMITTNALLKTNNLSDANNTNVTRLWTASYGSGSAEVVGNQVGSYLIVGTTNQPGASAGVQPFRFAVYSDTYAASTNSPTFNAHQGFATSPDGQKVWLADTAILIRCTNDSAWTPVLSNAAPFGSSGATHMGDIDLSPVPVNGSAYGNVIVAPLCIFPGDCLSPLTHTYLAVYDSTNLTLLSLKAITNDMGASGVCVVPEHGVVYESGFCGSAVGNYNNAIFRYDIKTLNPLPPIFLDSVCKEIQGIGYDSTMGLFYLSAIGSMYIVDLNGHVIATNNVIVNASGEGIDVKPGVIGISDGGSPGGRVHFFTNNFVASIIVKDNPAGSSTITFPDSNAVFSVRSRTSIGFTETLVPDAGLTLSTNVAFAKDNGYFVFDDGSTFRLGLIKKNGQLPKHVYGSGSSFTISESSATSLTNLVTGQTLTDRFKVDSTGVTAITGSFIGSGAGLTQLNAFDPMDVTKEVFYEPFGVGSKSTGFTIGSLGWVFDNAVAGTCTSQTGVANHPGIQRLGTTVTTSSLACISLCDTPTTAIALLPALNATTGWTNTFIFSISTTTNNQKVYVGLVGISFNPTNGPPPNWFGIQLDATNDTVFKYVSRAAGVSTTTASGITADTAYHTFRVWSTVSGTLSYKLDADAVTTIASNVPSTTLSPFFFICNSSATTGSAGTLDCDLWSCIMTGLAR